MTWLLGLLILTAPGPQEANLGGPGARAELSLEAADATAFVADDAFVERALGAFRTKSASERARILASVRAAVDAVDDPYLASLRPFAARARENSRSKVGRLPWKDPGVAEAGGDPALYDGLPFPTPNQYRFGFRSIVPVVGEGRRRPRFPAAAPDDEQLRAMLRGFPPDVDLILAGIMRELDNDRSADRYACFLECWRDGDESFYRALDRTAGRQGGVFFFDAMLEDYLRSFVPRSHPDAKRLRRSNDNAHDALHTAFLNYRQYRAFREAIAMALVLPPWCELPRPLSRYAEPQQVGEYNLRQQVEMLLRIHGQDVEKIIAGVTAGAAPLPEHLWSGTYSPFAAFREFYRPSLDQTDELDGDSELLLNDQLQRRNRVAARIAKAARAALADSGIE